MVAASREFVCVRPQTFESAEESKVLEEIFRGRQDLQNTVFALLDPDGKALIRGSRSPGMTYGSVERFLEALKETSAEYAQDAKAIRALPVVKDLRLALNVAAADLRPLVVVRGDGDKEAQKLAERVAEVAWSESTIGRFHYVVVTEEVTHEGFTPEPGVTVVEPEAYGRGGEVRAHVGAAAKDRALVKTLAKGLEDHDVADKHYERHVRQGRREGIHWESAIESTDAHRKRGRRRDR